MTKIIQAVRPTAAHRIAAEQRAIADVERELADLEQQRAAALLLDDPAEALKLGTTIATARRRLETHQDRLKAFHAQGRRETGTRRQQQKAEALAVFEKQFAERATTAERVTKAAAEFAAALQAHRDVCRIPFSEWPHDLFPSIKIFEGLAQSHIDSKIAGALKIQWPGAAFELLSKMPDRLGNLAEQEVALGASIAADIRNAPLPDQRGKVDEGMAAA